MTLLDQLNWRYATKKFDPARSVPEEIVHRITEAVRLAPSSNGLQPYELLVVTNRALREELLPAAHGQTQLVDGSHLLVFAAWDDYTPDRINRHFDRVNSERGGSTEGVERYRKQLLERYPSRGPEVNHGHAARQAYLGVGVALVAAAVEGVDSTPMEGFDPAQVDRILGLRELGLRSVVLMPLGYRAAEGDWLVGLKKVRRPREEFVTERR